MKSEAITTKKRPKGWQKGQSGNPKGRPKKELCLTSQLEAVLNEEADITIGKHRYRGRSKARVLAERMVDKAILSVNPQLCKVLVDRIDGPVDKIDHASAPNISHIEIVNIESGSIFSFPAPAIVRDEGQPVSGRNAEIGNVVPTNIFGKKEAPKLIEAKGAIEEKVENP